MAREPKSISKRSDYVSFLLRLWRDDGGDKTCSGRRPAPWRGSLENPLTGQRLGFPNLEALFQFLRAETGAEDSSSPEPGQTSKSSHKHGTWIAAMGVCLVVFLMAWCAPIVAVHAVTQVAPSGSTQKTLENAAETRAAVSYRKPQFARQGLVKEVLSINL